MSWYCAEDIGLKCLKGKGLSSLSEAYLMILKSRDFYILHTFVLTLLLALRYW